ncbi:MAG: DUF262 domain-containing HNH endonuclease family protein, partial [bacterium]|nr:DUF262 domain-containing HNH endonuclease family protein [bacterium]
DAKAYGLSYLKNSIFFRIPFFQRPYVWKSDNWVEFYETLKESIINKKSTFLGSIILKDTGDRFDFNSENWEKPIYEVIDGQQRLTTISLFFRAYYDAFIKNDTQKIIDYGAKFNDAFYTKWQESKTNRHIKILHSYFDRKPFEKCMKGNLNIGSITSDSDQISKCYQYFYNELKNEKNMDIIDKFMEYLLNDDEKYKIMVIIKINNDENEQQIFNTINSSGVRLTVADLIKNALFDKLNQLTENKQDVIEFYNKTWTRAFLLDFETSKYWSKLSLTGRLERERLEILLHSIAIIKGFYDQREGDKLENLHKKFASYIKDMDLETLKNFIIEICGIGSSTEEIKTGYAQIYQEHFFDFVESDLFSLDDRNKVFHKMLEIFDTTTFNPYILSIYKRVEAQILNSDEANKLLLKLEKLIARSLICKSQTKKNFNNENINLIMGKSNIDSLLSDDSINDESFRLCLRNINNDYAKAVLFMIELNRINPAENAVRSIVYGYQLEHIMPQKFQQFWSIETLPVFDNEGKFIDNPEIASQTRTNSIYQIGNMTLLTGKLNNKIKNFDFTRKKIGSNGQKGMADYSSLLVTKQVINEEVWNEAKILKRTIQLTNEILEVW